MLISRDIMRLAEGTFENVTWPVLILNNFSRPGISVQHTVAGRCQSLLHNVVTLTGDPTVMLDCLSEPGVRFVTQERWLAYGGGPRAIAELQRDGVVPPEFIIMTDGTIGIALDDAVTVAEGMLRDFDWPLLGSTRASIKVRIGWKGYDPWVNQIQLRTHSTAGDREPISRAAFVRYLASRVIKFLNEAERAGPSNDADVEFRIGSRTNEISSANIVLVGAVAVSQGSIMPLLQLR
ncbi:hypothetical protein BV25DRAFT_1856651 [Artomyces pyxidatus]|uniref:Uncharacterized protein n=1 Tax=Artomyces pyxidatus TaxID=48021 RepID=A0ACB8T131_9AGAM|nr:hypothetical protein BV25DRAFT_1856651 [Artomyces pyxidatus]